MAQEFPHGHDFFAVFLDVVPYFVHGLFHAPGVAATDKGRKVEIRIDAIGSEIGHTVVSLEEGIPVLVLGIFVQVLIVLFVNLFQFLFGPPQELAVFGVEFFVVAYQAPDAV